MSKFCWWFLKNISKMNSKSNLHKNCKSFTFRPSKLKLPKFISLKKMILNTLRPFKNGSVIKKLKERKTRKQQDKMIAKLSTFSWLLTSKITHLNCKKSKLIKKFKKFGSIKLRSTQNRTKKFLQIIGHFSIGLLWLSSALNMCFL